MGTKDLPIIVMQNVSKSYSEGVDALHNITLSIDKGEFVFVVEGADIEELESREQQKWEQVPIEEHMQNYLAQGMERKEAMKAVAKDRGMTKNQVYKELMR